FPASVVRVCAGGWKPWHKPLSSAKRCTGVAFRALCRWQTRALLLLYQVPATAGLRCDARIAPDPLSGQGIIWAIDDGASAMELLTRMRWRDLAQDMRTRTLRDVEDYLFERSRVYLSEQRFKGDVYWSAVSRSSANLPHRPAAPADR